MSGVPHGSVLGPMLFLICINDLEDDISSKILKFEDDTTVFRKVTNDTDKQSLQDNVDKLLHENLDKLVKWSEKWQILFNLIDMFDRAGRKASQNDNGLQLNGPRPVRIPKTPCVQPLIGLHTTPDVTSQFK